MFGFYPVPSSGIRCRRSSNDRQAVVTAIPCARRESDYFRDLGTEPTAAKEIRLFGLTPWLIGRYRSSAVVALLLLWRNRRPFNVRHFLWFTAMDLVVVG